MHSNDSGVCRRPARNRCGASRRRRRACRRSRPQTLYCRVPVVRDVLGKRVRGVENQPFGLMMRDVDLQRLIVRVRAGGTRVDASPVWKRTRRKRLIISRHGGGIWQVVQVRRPDQMMRDEADVRDACAEAAAEIAVQRKRRLLGVGIAPVDVVSRTEVRLTEGGRRRRAAGPDKDLRPALRHKRSDSACRSGTRQFPGR